MLIQRLIMVVLVAVAVPTYCLAQHPAEGQPLNPLDGLYAAGNSDRTPAWDFGDIVMTGNKPEPGSLTQLEKYMVAGTSASALPNGLGLAPWKQEVWAAVAAYYRIYGKVPARLTPDALLQLPQLSSANDQFLSIYRNPLTGEWPRLDARNPAPGDVFIKPLNPAEMRYYANMSKRYTAEWYGGADPYAAQPHKRLDGKVWYVRVYGLHGILCEQFYWVMEDY
jgi:hypothetical protein